MERIGAERLDRRWRRLRLIADGSGAVAAGIAACILILWITRIGAGVSDAKFLFAMKPNTAIGFGLTALAFILLVHQRPRLASVVALLPMLIGLLSLIQYAARVDLGIDQLVLRDWSATGVGHPGRPAPNTAITLLVFDTTLIALAAIRGGSFRPFVTKLVAFAVIALAMATIAGYIAHSDFAIGWGTREQMSIPSTVCALALGCGLLAYGWQVETAATALMPVWIPALLCFAVVLFDIATPLQINAGICYIPIILCALWFDRPSVAFILAVAASLLIVFGLFASPPGAVPFSISILNRGLAMIGVWVVATLVYLQRTSQQRLLRNARHLASAQELASIGSFELEFAGMTFKASREFEQLHGVAFEAERDWELFLRRFVPVDERDGIREMIRAAQAGENPPDFHYSFLRADGTVRNAVMHCELLHGYEQMPMGIIGIIKDVTEAREAEAREAAIGSQLRHAQKLESLGTLAGGIAHDLNNTLVPMTTLLPVILEDTRDPMQRRALEITIDAARRAKALVREILSFSRKEESDVEAIRLDELAGETLTIVRAGVPTGIIIQAELSPVPEIVASKGQIYQIILNLVTNAAQAIGDRRGCILIGTRADDGGMIRLYVSDDGAGMDEETQARIFEPFFSTKEAGRGTGLGLSIVSGIVASHGGTISVESTLGFGTRFDLVFPVEGRQDRDTPPPKQAMA
jgi:PAS domain S-box-containing protein